MRRLISVLLMITAFNAFADENSLKVIESLPELNRVVVSKDESMKVNKGDIYIYSRQSYGNCILIVIDISGEFYSLDSSKCNIKSEIVIGDILKKSLIDFSKEENKDLVKKYYEKVFDTEKNLSQFEKHRLAISLYYSLANNISFPDVIATKGSVTGNGSAELGTENSLGFSATLSNMPNKDLGYSISFLYEPDRSLKKLNIVENSVTTTRALSGSTKVAFSLIEGGATYRYNSHVFIGGINYSMPQFKASNSGITTVNGDIGSVFGWSYLLTNNASVDLFYRTIKYKQYGEIPENSTSYDFGSGQLIGASFGLKFWF